MGTLRAPNGLADTVALTPLSDSSLLAGLCPNVAKCQSKSYLSYPSPFCCPVAALHTEHAKQTLTAWWAYLQVICVWE